MTNLTLTKGQMWTPSVSGKLTVRGVSGTGWATYEGDPRDYVLDRIHKFSFPAGAGLIVQAVEDMEFCFEAE